MNPTQITARMAVEVLIKAFQEDPDYAHTWHCNVAMMCDDAIGKHALYLIRPDLRYTISQDAASRFMKLAFDVETAPYPKTGQI